MATSVPSSIAEPDNPLCFWIFDSASPSKKRSIYISQNGGFPITEKYSCIFVDNIKYVTCCDNIGPVNLASIAVFEESLNKAIAESKFDSIVVCAKKGCRALTNAAFLLGAYLILKHGETPTEVAERFLKVSSDRFEGYRDATHSTPTFHVELIDCWSGLHRAVSRKWFECPSRAHPQMWGMIDMDEYIHYDDPLNADLHEVVPGKFIAFQGPRDLPEGQVFLDTTSNGARCFSPSYYVDIFQELGVTTVIRLNEPLYSRRILAAAGIDHHDLYFDDCTAPPPDVVARFFAVAKAAPGAVAVHCKAGLGRTGTLIALWLMRSEGFTAREAMGWLRIVRPGSVIGEQQHFLCEVERGMRKKQAAGSAGASRGLATVSEGAAVRRSLSQPILARPSGGDGSSNDTKLEELKTRSQSESADSAVRRSKGQPGLARPSGDGPNLPPIAEETPAEAAAAAAAAAETTAAAAAAAKYRAGALAEQTVVGAAIAV
jgi:hypothetical protein